MCQRIQTIWRCRHKECKRGKLCCNAVDPPSDKHKSNPALCDEDPNCCPRRVKTDLNAKRMQAILDEAAAREPPNTEAEEAIMRPIRAEIAEQKKKDDVEQAKIKKAIAEAEKKKKRKRDGDESVGRVSRMKKQKGGAAPKPVMSSKPTTAVKTKRGPRGRPPGAISKTLMKPGSKPQSKPSNREDEEMSDINNTEASFIVDDEDSDDDLKNYDPEGKFASTEGAPSEGDDSEPEAEAEGSDDSPPNSSPHDSELPATASPGSKEESEKGSDSDSSGDDHPSGDEGPGSDGEGEGEPVEEEGGSDDEGESVGGDTVRISSPEPEDDGPDADPAAAPPVSAPAPAPASVPYVAPAPARPRPVGRRPHCNEIAKSTKKRCKLRAQEGRTKCHHH